MLHRNTTTYCVKWTSVNATLPANGLRAKIKMYLKLLKILTWSSQASGRSARALKIFSQIPALPRLDPAAASIIGKSFFVGVIFKPKIAQLKKTKFVREKVFPHKSGSYQRMYFRQDTTSEVIKFCLQNIIKRLSTIVYLN